MSSKPRSNPSGASTGELRLLLMSFKPQYKQVFWFTLITTVLSLSSVVYMQEVYGRVVNSRSGSTLLMLTVVVLAAYLFLELFESVRTRLMQTVADQFERRLRQRVFDLSLDAQLKQVPALGMGGQEHARRLRDFLPSPAMLAIFDAPMALVFLVLVFWIHPTLGYFSLVGALVQFLMSYLAEQRTQKPFEASQKAAAESHSFATSVFRSARIVRALGMESAIHRKWLGKQNEFLMQQAMASDHAGFNAASSKFVMTFQGSMILGISAWLHLKGEFNAHPGMMIIASILGGKILQPLMVLTSQWRLLSGAVDAYRQLNRALDAVAERPQTMSLPAPNGALTAEQLTAGFAGRPPVLRGIQFELKPGELLAVVGPSASGKSTLCRLLVGVMAANAGKVRLDGADVYTWNKDELGQYIGYLSQDVELLDGTVEDNVCRFGDPDQTQYQKAVELAGADALIEQLPEREKFQIDDGQSTLSGGERQRLGLARAFYGLPRLLVLDEPNASLDEQAEARLMSALQWFKSQGSMVVLVSHQKRVLQVADKILVLRDGQQLAFGPRDEVLARLSGKAQTKQVVA